MKLKHLLAAAALAVAAVPTSASANTTIALPASDIYGFAPSVVPITTQAEVLFINVDPVAAPAGAPHDVRAREFRADKNAPWCVNFPGTQKCPLFYTPLIGAPETAIVQGTQDLIPGETYEFYCTVHDGTMIGSFVVTS